MAFASDVEPRSGKRVGTSRTDQPRRWLRRLPAAIVGSLILCATVAGMTSPDRFLALLRAAGEYPWLVWGALVLAITLGGPASLLYASAGALVTPTLALPMSLSAGALGATGQYLVGRKLGQGWVPRWLAAPQSAGPARASDHRLLELAALRANPFVPFVLLNIALGASRVSIRAFLSTLPVMWPIATLYTLMGSAAFSWLIYDRSIWDTAPLVAYALMAMTVLSVCLVIVARSRRHVRE